MRLYEDDDCSGRNNDLPLCERMMRRVVSEDTKKGMVSYYCERACISISWVL